MTRVKGAWSRAELETFLDEALVPVRLGCHHSKGGLWMLSLWYEFTDGTIRCATSSGSDVADFLRANDSVSFEISTNQPPYMGVRGSGTASLSPDEDKKLLESLIERYLGGTDSELATMLLTDDREELVITVEPRRLYSWDFTDRMQSAITDSPAARKPEPSSPKYTDPSEDGG
jgi:nitroimidazol reductase NimA-like FMN-containing flavoprotein (pyridoxamine 5'-phosphate oxidase superfamily)